MAGTRVGGKKSKRRDDRPARKRYWMKRTLEKKKIRHLVRFCGMIKETAEKLWHTDSKRGRKGRVPDGFLKQRK